MQRHTWVAFGVCAVFVASVVTCASLAHAVVLNGPSYSSPIAVTPDDKFVWVVNPDNNSVSVINVQNDANQKVAEVTVGIEPQNLAISPDGNFVYVSNTVSGTVSVITANPTNPFIVATIAVGAEPYGLAFTPNGSKLYVANARSNTVHVINPRRNRVKEVIEDVGLEPRGIAITNDGDDDDRDERVYVTQFLGVDRPGVLIGRDDYKEGRVTVILTNKDRVISQVVLAPLVDTGFKSNGSALGRVPATAPPTFFFTTDAFPNMLNSVVIKGNRAYLPNTASSSDGPVRFNVNVQAFLSVIDTTTDTEGAVGSQRQTINMNRGINFEPAGPNKFFFGVPWAIAFKRTANEGYVVNAASNFVAKVVLDPNGTPTINAPTQAGDPGNIKRIFVGQNPRGIAINGRDDRAYVMNEVSRDVSVINLPAEQVIATVSAAALPPPGTLAATVQLGKAIFNSSTGVNLPQLGPLGTIANDRLSNEGWSGCFSCHPFGLTDGVVWIFGAGPRRTLSLHSTFNPADPNDQKILNYSAIFDEVQDFEANIRGVSGGRGLITQADGVTPDPTLNAFALPNAGRSAQLDALKEYVARGIRTPLSPFILPNSPDRPSLKGLARGRELFEKAGCVACHAGAGWSVSRRDFTPPPTANQISNGQLVRFLKKVGTFDPAAANEVRQNGAPALGADGFNPPSLLGAFALGPLLHNGSALTLDDIVEDVTHRSAGTGGVDTLSDKRDRRRLVKFLSSIDTTTTPFVIK